MGNSLSPSGGIGLRKYFADIIILLRITIKKFVGNSRSFAGILVSMFCEAAANSQFLYVLNSSRFPPNLPFNISTPILRSLLFHYS